MGEFENDFMFPWEGILKRFQIFGREFQHGGWAFEIVTPGLRVDCIKCVLARKRERGVWDKEGD